jgi:two-component system phosphate regulon sensor histidine kinase PhoR
MNSAWLLAGAFALTSSILLFRLLHHRRERHRLLAWLRNPEQEIPNGTGAWIEVFSAQQQLYKAERKQRTQFINQLERFQKAAEALPDGILLLDSHAYIEWMNSAAAEHLGLHPDRDIGTQIGHLIRNTEFHDFFDRFQVGKAGAPFLLALNGEQPLRTLSLHMVSFSETGILLLSRDVTEIAKADTVRRDFIANVSHELRTPITVISGFLEQLTGNDRPPESVSQRFIGLMAEQAQRMSRLVEDLLTLSRLETGSEPLREDVVDVPGIVHSVLAEGQALSKGRHTIAIIHICSARLRGNADELRSAFGNLVSNAVRYTPAEGTISLSWRLDMDIPTFIVNDTGIGISSEHIPRLTERFYRVDKGRSTVTGGTGLGLAIVKHVAARHQGSLAIRSQIGQGSSFILSFPVSRCVKTAD